MKRFLLPILLLTFVSLLYLASKAIPAYIFSQAPVDVETLSGYYDTRDVLGQYYGRPIAASTFSDTQIAYNNILGVNNEDKRIEVDLTNQRLYGFEGNNKVYDFLISSGKWGRTPTGTFRIWTKLRYTKMSGGSKELRTYYYLPNVPFTMYSANAEVPAYRGFGIHGTYWHNNFGHPMSHGCINMRTEDAEKLFYWATPVLGDKPSIRATTDNPGTTVVIYGTAPPS